MAVKSCNVCGDELIYLESEDNYRCGTCGKYFSSLPGISDNSLENSFTDSLDSSAIQNYSVNNVRGNYQSNDINFNNKNKIYSNESASLYLDNLNKKLEIEDDKYIKNFVNELDAHSLTNLLRAFNICKKYKKMFNDILRELKLRKPQFVNNNKKLIESIKFEDENQNEFNDLKENKNENGNKIEIKNKNENENENKKENENENRNGIIKKKVKKDKKENENEKNVINNVISKLNDYNMNTNNNYNNKNVSSNALLEISMKLTETHKELNKMNEKCEKKKNKIKYLKNEISNHKMSINEHLLKEEIYLSKIKKANENILKLEKINKKKEINKTNQMTNLIARLELLETENNRLKEKEQIFKNQNSNESKIRQDLEIECESLKSKLSENIKKLKIYRSNCLEFKSSFEAIKDRAKNKLNEAGNLYKNIYLQLNSKKEALKQLKTQFNALKLENENFSADLKTQLNLKEQFQKRNENMEIQINKLETKNKTLNKDNNNSKEKINDLENEIESIKSIKKQFMNQILEKQDEIAKIKEISQNNMEINNEIIQLRKQLDSSIRENHELKSRIFDETEKNKAAKEENKELLVYLDRLLKERGE